MITVICICDLLYPQTSRHSYVQHLSGALLAEDFESRLAEERICKAVSALFLCQVSTQHALLRT